MRLLGVDFGFARIGIAVGEAEHGIVTARPAIQATGALKRDAQTLAALATREHVDRVIVGLPRGSEGEEGRMARICRTLAEHIEELGWKVHLVDERLTTVEAEAALTGQALSAARRARRRDGEAARLILERFIHEQEVG